MSSQPYYSTRVNAADIDSRVKQLDQTTQNKQEGEGQKSKAGFWEEFDVRFLLAVVYSFYNCFSPACFDRVATCNKLGKSECLKAFKGSKLTSLH